MPIIRIANPLQSLKEFGIFPFGFWQFEELEVCQLLSWLEQSRKYRAYREFLKYSFLFWQFEELEVCQRILATQLARAE